METATENIEVKAPTGDAQTNEVVVEMENLKKSFGENHVLKNIDLKITKGENIVVLGKSGSGKSVLIKCLVRLLDADEGKLIVLGKEMSTLNDEELNTIRKKIGFLFLLCSALLFRVMETLSFRARSLNHIAQRFEKEILFFF